MAGVTFQGTPFADAPQDPDMGGDYSLGAFGQALGADVGNQYRGFARGVQDLGMGALGYKVPLSDSSDPLTLTTGGHITPAGENIIMAMGGRALASEPHPNELGIFGGSGAKLAPAKDSGKWFTGVDGKPRFEINDAHAKMKAGDLPDMRQTGPNEMMSSRLGNALHHPELYKQYPELADYTLHLQRMDPHTLGISTPGQPYLILNPVRQAADGSVRMATKNELTGVMLHELQHTVQEKEGFAPGGNPADAQAALLGLAEQSRQHAWAARQAGDIQGYVGHVTDMNRLKEMAQYPVHAYSNLAGEVEARNVQRRYAAQKETTRQTGASMDRPLTDLGISAQQTQDTPTSRQFIFPQDQKPGIPVSHDPFSPPSPWNPHPVEHDPFAPGAQEARVLPPEVTSMGRPANQTQAEYDADTAKVEAKLDEMRNRILGSMSTGKPIPDNVKSAMQSVGNLGFDRPSLALMAARRNPDWAERWDVNPHRSLMEYKAHRDIQDYINSTGGHR